MAVYLNEVPVYTIILIGWWSSDAFRGYIQKQVEQFSHSFSARMICHQHFTHIPISGPHTFQYNPFQCNHRNNFATKINRGGVTPTRVQLPTMAIWAYTDGEGGLKSNTRDIG